MHVTRPTQSDAEVLLQARRLATEVLRPRAEQVDSGALPLADNLAAVAQAGLAGLPVGVDVGGVGASASLQRQVARELASACGVTQFTLAQHWSACKILAQSPSEGLRSRLVPLLAAGRRWVAISFAHLRRPGAPMLRATPVDGGLRLDGTAPWLTGWGIMDSAVLGATLPDGHFVYVWTALAGTADALSSQPGHMHASETMSLCAMTASATVTLELSDWFIPAQHVLSYTDRAALQQQDRDNVLSATTLTLGVLRAEAHLLEDMASKRDIEAVRQAATTWRGVVDGLESEVEALLEAPGPLDYDAALQVRARTIQHAVTGAHLAVAAASGSANLLTHPAQRLFREAMFYTVQAQTPDVQAATLRRLC